MTLLRSIPGPLRLIVVTVSLVVVPALYSSAPQAISECAEAAEWVSEHASQLPTTLAGLARLTPVYRRAAFDALPPETRASLWREQMQTFLAVTPALTAPQRALVQEATLFLTPDTYSLGPPPELREYTARLKVEFKEGAHIRAFTVLASLEEQTAVQPRRYTTTTLRDSFVFMPVTVSASECTCSAVSDWCGWGQECRTYPVWCTYTSGCGTFWSYECRGECVSQ